MGQSKVPALQIGERVGRYTIINRFNRYAYHACDADQVVLKYLLSPSDPEVLVLSTAHHPNIVGFKGTIMHTQHPLRPQYAIIEYAGKRSLDRAHDLQLNEILGVGAAATDALIHMHEVLGYVHNDVKPANICLGESVKLLDFENATPIRISYTQNLGGTPGFRSPQEMEGYNGPENDVFSLGATMYALLQKDAPYLSAVETPSWKLLAADEQISVERASFRKGPARIRLGSPLGELIQGMIEIDERNRPSLREAKAIFRHATRANH